MTEVMPTSAQLGVPPPGGAIEAVERPAIPADVAVGQGDDACPGSDQVPHQPAHGVPRTGVHGGRPQPLLARLGGVLPPRELRRQVQPDGLLRPPAAGPLGDGAPWTPGLGLVHLVSQGMAPCDRGLSPDGNRPVGSGVCRSVNDVGEPCAREPHARFDGGELEKEQPGCGDRRLAGSP